MNWKKYLKITLYILVTIGLVWIGYFLFTKTGTSTQQTTLITETKITNEVSEAQLSLKIDEPILNYWTDKTTGSVYFINQSGEIIKIANEQMVYASAQTLENLNSIKISPDGTKILAVFNYPNRPTISIYDNTNNNWQPVSVYAISAAWSPDSKKIAYLEDAGETGSLKIIDLTTQKINEVVKISIKDGDLEWINPDEITIKDQKPSADLPSSLWKIKISDKTWKKALENVYGLDIAWSKTEDFGLMLSNINRKPILNLIDKTGNNLTALSFITIPEKCVIENKKIYCGVPRGLKEGLNLPDDYFKRNVYFEDDIFLFDLSNGTASVIFSNKETPIDAYNLQVKDERELLFINRYDDKLYSLPI